MDKPILLFDGVCNLCNGAVQFIIERDPSAVFRFASLQSEQGQQLAANHGVDSTRLDTLILLQNGKAYTRSSAVLRIAAQLRGGWPLLQIGYLIPPFIRDALYNFVASRRYKWWGKQDACWIPTPALKARFLA